MNKIIIRLFFLQLALFSTTNLISQNKIEKKETITSTSQAENKKSDEAILDSLTKAAAKLSDSLSKYMNPVVDKSLLFIANQISDMANNIAYIGRAMEEEAKKQAAKKAADTLKEHKEKIIEMKDGKIIIDMGKSNELIGDSTEQEEISVIHKDHEIRMKKVKTQWLGLDFGLNNYISSTGFKFGKDADGLDLVPGTSYHTNLHIIRQGVNLIKHSLYFVYGLNYEFNNYTLKNDITWLQETDKFSYGMKDSINFSKNKIATQYMNIPVLLHFETNPRKPHKSVGIGIGGYAGVFVKAYNKQTSERGTTNRYFDDYNLNKWQYGTCAEVGVGKVRFFGSYALSGLFEKDKGPLLRPLTVGLVLNGFDWY